VAARRSVVMQKLKARCAVYRVSGRIRRGFACALVGNCALEERREPAGDRRGACARGPGERLVAFSLASFAGHDARAWPGAATAAARAGLSRSRYLHDRDQLVRRGLLVVERWRRAAGARAWSWLGSPSRVRGGRRRSTPSCSRTSCLARARAGPRGCYSPRWPRSPIRTASCLGCRARSCAPRRAWRIGRTAGRAGSCWSPASWHC
jgi:hypothetical protein